jgi:hypothetical protein
MERVARKLLATSLGPVAFGFTFLGTLLIIAKLQRAGEAAKRQADVFRGGFALIGGELDDESPEELLEEDLIQEAV